MSKCPILSAALLMNPELGHPKWLIWSSAQIDVRDVKMSDVVHVTDTNDIQVIPSAVECMRGDCELWVNTYTTEGIRRECCGLIQPSFVREV